MLGDFAKAIDDAILDSSAAQQNQMMQLLSDPTKAKRFSKLMYDLLTVAV
jgi:type I restriction enzyme R subunit